MNLVSKNKYIKFIFRFLKSFCPNHLYEEIEGDLIQKFNRDVKTFGERKAIRNLIWNVVRFFRPGILLRNTFAMNFISLTLLHNYFKISFRYMAKNKAFAVVNVLGLALGMSAALLICEYVHYEKNYDTFHSGSANIYRVSTEWNPDQTPDDKRATTVPWSGPGVKEAFPEVIEFTRFAPLTIMTGTNSFRFNDISIEETNIYLADPGFLKIFSFSLIEGDKKSALSVPYQIIITERIAKKYFGNESPLGKSLFLDSHGNLSGSDYKVAGVIQNPPINSHMSFDFLISYSSMWPGLNDGSTYWHWDNTYCYLLLHPETNVTLLEQKISDLRVKKYSDEFGIWTDVIAFKLQPITDIHLFSSLKGEMGINGNGRALTFLIIIGIFIQLSAYINYINLGTVKAVERRTEIGIRKVVGSSKIQLVFQLLIEAIVINFTAVMLAIMISRISIPLIENVFNVQWPEWNFPPIEVIIVMLTIVLTGTLISAIYPAIVITSFKPIEALKANKPIINGNIWSFRKSLTLVQFIFCIAFTIGTYGLYQQLKFMKNHDLGMSMDQVVAVRAQGFQPYQNYKDFKTRLSSSSLVSSVASSSAAPGDEILMLGLRPKVSVGDTREATELKMLSVDDDFFETLKVEFLAGRNFDLMSATEGKAVILNETAVHLLGYDDPSKILHQPLHDELNNREVEIVGVIKNYHQLSLNSSHEPIMFVPNWIPENMLGWNQFYYFVRLDSSIQFTDVSKAIDEIEHAWKASTSELPFNYFFLDNYFERNYRSDTTFSSLFLFFCAFAIFIACLGLFGLVSYTTLQRAKEIGVRKVLGASVQHILVLLSKEVAITIFIAGLITTPLVGIGLSKWIESYAFRIDLSIQLFAYPMALIFMVSMVTVMVKSLTVANDNPVNSLRSE